MAVSKSVKRLIQAEVGPIVEAMGFEFAEPGTAMLDVGPASFAFEWLPTRPDFDRAVGFPKGGVFAMMGVDYGRKTSTSFFERDPDWKGDTGDMSVVLMFCRSAGLVGNEMSGFDAWPIGDDDLNRRSIADLKSVIERDGPGFVDQWSDLETAQRTLLNAPSHRVEGALGRVCPRSG